MLSLALVASCGRISFASVDGSHGDGGSNADGALADAAMLGTFGTKVLVDELNSGANDEEPSFTEDRLDIVLRRGPQIFEATRATTSSPWADIQPVVAIDGDGYEINPALTADGLALYFSTDISGTNDIWVVTRATRQSAWSAPVRVDDLDTNANETGSYVTPDGKHFVYESDMLGDNYDLYIAERTGLLTFGAAVPLEAVNSTADDGEGRLFDSGRGVVFSSSREGSTRGSDIYIATRPMPSGPFSNVRALDEINSLTDDFDPWISEDGHVLMFSQVGSSGSYDLFEVMR
jgi:Tol biopolymer transport system component